MRGRRIQNTGRASGLSQTGISLDDCLTTKQRQQLLTQSVVKGSQTSMIKNAGLEVLLISIDVLTVDGFLVLEHNSDPWAKQHNNAVPASQCLDPVSGHRTHRSRTSG